MSKKSDRKRDKRIDEYKVLEEKLINLLKKKRADRQTIKKEVLGFVSG